MLDASPTKTVTFNLNGEDVTVPEGWTIWEAAKGEGRTSPHLGHKTKPGYRPDGNCRACMVEGEGERTLVASCIRPAAEGMVVKTDSDRAEKSRAMVMELLVADQPDDQRHLRPDPEAGGVCAPGFDEQPDAERQRGDHRRIHDDSIEFRLHDLEALPARGVGGGGVVNEQPRQVKQAGEPAHHGD